MPRSKDAVAVWTSGLAFDVTATLSGFSVRVDGEAKKGFSPMELVIVGLAGCTGGDAISILQKKRQKVTAFEVRVHGERADDYPRKYTNIEVTYIVTGRGIDPEAVRRAIELSETKYCSVSATVRGVAKITSRFEIREAEPIAA
jgi:putative redox protein